MSSDHAPSVHDGPGGPEVVCAGETMALLVPDPGTPEPGSGEALGAAAPGYRLEIGGAESNVAVYLARAGHRVTWHSALGDDAFGRHVLARLAAEGVDCSVATDPARRTGLYVKEPDGAGGTLVRYYRTASAATALGGADAARIRAQQPRIVHTTGITAVLSPSCRELVDGLLDGAAPGTLRSFDVNYRPALHGPAEAEVLLRTARRADVVFCGLDEAAALWEAVDAASVRALLEGPELVVVKQGADGATAFRGAQSWHEPAPEVGVVEPTGAGDAFAAGVLHGLLIGADVPASLAEGARLAGAVLGVPGDIPPRSDTGDGFNGSDGSGPGAEGSQRAWHSAAGGPIAPGRPGS
ncbi:sugar kinase [Streptomonospora litoralis]|uniref:2-dehydro-3-deoxygluconokinase n=1 Tax=Streptomonospora litoralis TaxID=2498135 RepID=A0A4V0ZJZ4_9ACTN|nr:sugar kinase [Streptomonospora litoralis]QBI55192.1 2-dehydro-3-deoxygluconokinase [Streptomonospora litoralis]